MTSMPPNDPLVSLWKTAPKPDTQRLVQDLQRLSRLHHRLDRSVFAILCGFSLLLTFEEATGRVSTHGALSVIWILGLVLGAFVRRRARCSRIDALTTLDTVRLLEFMIARAKSDLLVARCLYAGVPCGAAAGYFVMKLASVGAPAIAVSERLHLIQTGAGIAALIAMMVAGVILARSRSLQVRELSEKLKLIQADL